MADVPEDIEMRLRFYYDGTEDCVEVADDADGLGLTDVRYRDETDTIKARITLNGEQVDKLIAMLRQKRAFDYARGATQPESAE